MALSAKIGVLLTFWQFRAATQIKKANCAEITTDRPREPAYEMFDIELTH